MATAGRIKNLVKSEHDYFSEALSHYHSISPIVFSCGFEVYGSCLESGVFEIVFASISKGVYFGTLNFMPNKDIAIQLAAHVRDVAKEMDSIEAFDEMMANAGFELVEDF